MSSTRNKLPIFLLFCVALLDLIGFGIVIPILPFLSPTLGATKFDIALIIVVYAVCSGAMSPFWGRLSDRWGRKRTLMLCLLGAAVSYIALAFAHALWMIFAARAFAGLMAGNLPVAAAMMADLTSLENRASAMGKLGAAFGLGLVVGPFLGGLLSGDTGSFVLPCLVAAAMSLLALGAAGLFLQETVSAQAQAQAEHRRRSEPYRFGSSIVFLRRTQNLRFVSQFTTHSAVISSITYLLPIWTADNLGYTPKEVGMVLGIQGLIMAIIQGGLIGRLIDRFGEIPLMRTALLALVFGLCLAVVASGHVAIPLAFFIAMTGANFCFPILNSLASKRADAKHRGQMMGATGSASAWGRVVGPLVVGFTVTHYGYPAAWAVLVVASLYYVHWAYRVAQVDSESLRINNV